MASWEKTHVKNNMQYLYRDMGFQPMLATQKPQRP